MKISSLIRLCTKSVFEHLWFSRRVNKFCNYSNHLLIINPVFMKTRSVCSTLLSTKTCECVDLYAFLVSTCWKLWGTFLRLENTDVWCECTFWTRKHQKIFDWIILQEVMKKSSSIRPCTKSVFELSWFSRRANMFCNRCNH